MSEEFVEANIDTEPAKVAEQESHYLFEVVMKKRRSLGIEYIYHWNRLLVATSRADAHACKCPNTKCSFCHN